MTVSSEEWVYHARGADGQMHVLVGEVPGATPHRTLCGQAVLVIYEHRTGTTCSECSRRSWPAQVPVASEPCG